MKKVFDRVRFGQNIRALRIQRGLSQRELAALVHCTPSWICAIENGRCSISVSMFLNLCFALNCSPADPLEGV